ncbi:hypothetical protein [Geminisphaera colitermitum]|uniref:hypothetical protein n=1 Tax=Geminisphaera colitermitum TaxID=1148786 RepID=UPI0005B8B10B|nr:hypothetical protein [Geminisphaera colitermitum]
MATRSLILFIFTFVSLKSILLSATATDAPLIATGRDYPLITPDAGEKQLRLTLSPTLRANSIRTEIRAHDVSAGIAPKILSSTTTSPPPPTQPTMPRVTSP